MIVVIGAGYWGTALAQVCSEKNDVIIVARESNIVESINKYRVNIEKFSHIKLNENIKATSDYAITKNAEIIIIATSLGGVVPVLEELKAVGTQGCIITSVKSMDEDSCSFPHQIIKKYFPNNNVGIISGPNYAKEVIEGKNSIASFACLYGGESIANKISCNYFKLDTSTQDIDAIASCGILKNIIAIGAGIITAAGCGYNALCKYFLSSCNEIRYLLSASNMDERILVSPAGIGDLALSCYTGQTRNYKYGYDLYCLGYNATIEKYKYDTIEGVKGTIACYRHNMWPKSHIVPIIYDAVINKQDIKIIAHKLLNLDISI